MREDVEQALSERMTAVPALAWPLPLPGLRGVIAERLSASWRDRPHVTLTTETDAAELVSARQQAVAALGHKVAYDAFLVAEMARALGEHPGVNARLGRGGIEPLAVVNIGLAVDTERGPLMPVVCDTPPLSLLDIHHRQRELAERALAGRSLPNDLTGGTFAIANLLIDGAPAARSLQRVKQLIERPLALFL
jgi:pyruvate dehydrogenase E2 component (dihydrolipoamide acetyltransferase)